MPDPFLFLQAAVASAGVSAIVVLALGWPRRPAGPMRLHAASLLAMAGGAAVGYRLLQIHWTWPPSNALSRFLTIVLPAALAIELLAGMPRRPRWFGRFLRLSLAAGIGRVLLHGSVYLRSSGGGWTASETLAVLSACGAGLLTVWSLLDWLAQRTPGVSIPIALSQSNVCAGIAVMLAGYVTGGAASLPLAAALVGTAIATRLLDPRPDLRGPIGIGVVGLFGLIFIGRFFGGLSTGSAFTLLSAPLFCWTTELPLLRRVRPSFVGMLRLAFVAIPLLVVVGLAKRTFDRELNPLRRPQRAAVASNLNAGETRAGTTRTRFSHRP